MSFFKSSFSIMRFDFKSKPCFSSVLGYLGLAVLVELNLNDAMSPWFLLVMFLHLPFAIWLSLVLAGLAVSDSDLSVLQACVSVFFGDQFSLGRI